jgi:hypothetical protein
LSLTVRQSKLECLFLPNFCKLAPNVWDYEVLHKEPEKACGDKQFFGQVYF